MIFVGEDKWKERRWKMWIKICDLGENYGCYWYIVLNKLARKNFHMNLEWE